VDQRPGQAQALLLSAGEHACRSVGEVSEVDQVEQLGGPGARRAGCHPVCRSHGLEHLAHRERIPGAEPVRHPAHGRPHLAWRGEGIEAADADRAGVGCKQGGQIGRAHV